MNFSKGSDTFLKPPNFTIKFASFLMRTKSAVDLKVVVLGASSVGKTSLITRYCKGTFTDDTLSTIGAGFFTHNISVDGVDVSLMIWDTAGQERFRSVAPSLLRGASGVILVYDCHIKETFDELDIYVEMFVDTLNAGSTRSMPALVLGNKCDIDQPIIDQQRVNDWLQRNRIDLSFIVSAKTGQNVELAFQKFIEELMTIESFDNGHVFQIGAQIEKKEVENQCSC